ncbi:MAG: energy-coupling factor ABC transporter ATP-binding protein [Spirulinaceae cyanobacterium]
MTTAETPAIKICDLQFSWSVQSPVLDHCSLAVPQGEFWMLLGANGSGKSTLLKLLAGVLQPQAGTIAITQPVGFVFQNPDHQLVMPTVGADVAFGLVDEGLSDQDVLVRVREALDAVNLLDLQRRPIYALSGGQKQRIAIAGAIARHCQLLILDEPTALLDPDTQIELVKQVQRLVKARGITALWVTHRLDELDYCDGVFWLQDGQIVAQGEPQSLKEKFLQSAGS